MTSRRRVFLLASTLTLAACSHQHAETVSPLDVPVTLNAVNNNPLPIEIFISGGGALFRLGVVHPGMTARFNIPPAFVGGQSVDFRVINNAGDGYRSGSFVLAPGEILDMTVAPRMFSSVTELRP